MSTPLRVYAAIGGQTLISAATFLVAKRVLFELGALPVALLRFFFAAAVFGALLAVRREARLPPRAALGRILLLGIVGLPLNQGLFLVGLERSTPAHAAILYALTPACVLLGARIFLKEKFSFARALGVVIAFAGVAAVLFERGLAAASGPLIGDLLILAAVLAWAVYTVWTRPLAQAYGFANATAWSLIAGAVLCLPAGPFLLDPDELARLSWVAIAGLAFLIVVTSVVAYLLWGYALERLEAAKVAIFVNLQPVATALLSWIFLGERLSALAAVGGGLVILGVTISQRK